MDVGKKNKHIFLLTDGEDGNCDQICKFAKKISETARIHTFGIGRDCDKKLVEETAYAGRGSCSFAYDNINLAKQVVDALRKSS